MYTYQTIQLGVGIVGIKKYLHLSMPLRIVEWYIFASIAVDIVKDILAFQKVHTLWIDNIFSVVELVLFAGMFYCWRTGKRNGQLLVGSFFLFLLIWIVGKFTFEPMIASTTYSGAVSQLVQIGFGVWLLFVILRDENNIWKNDPRLWVMSGIVFYAAGTFFLFGMFDEMWSTNPHLLTSIWVVNHIFIAIQSMFFLRAFLCKPQPATGTGSGAAAETVEPS
jgi:hypothetical protein